MQKFFDEVAEVIDLLFDGLSLAGVGDAVG
jgi:hypothetical protein